VLAAIKTLMMCFCGMEKNTTIHRKTHL